MPNLKATPEKVPSADTASRYDVGIVGFWYGQNYGSILTSYAIYRVVESLGYRAVHLNRPRRMWSIDFDNPDTIANKFIRGKCNVLEENLDYKTINEKCEIFLLGSDTVWNYNITKKHLPFFFLDFAEQKKKKITYASSFGMPKFTISDPELKAYVKYAANRLDAISVREDSGVSIMETEFGRKVTRVLDPVFLLPPEKYHQLSSEGSLNLPEQYAFIHTLNYPPKNIAISVCHKAKAELAIPAYIFADLNMTKEQQAKTGLDYVENESVENWLQAINNASIVVTTSFHATCFSIIFNTNFVAFTSHNTHGRIRFETLLTMLGLKDQLFYSDDEIPSFGNLLTRCIDYSKVNSILYNQQKKCRDWLAKALQQKKHTESPTELESITGYLTNEIAVQQQECENLQKKFLPVIHFENMPQKISGLSGSQHLADSFILRMAFRIEYLHCKILHKFSSGSRKKQYADRIKALETGHRLLFGKL